MIPRTLVAFLLVLCTAASVSALNLAVSPTTLTLPIGDTNQVTLTFTNTLNHSINVTALHRLDSISQITTGKPGLPFALAAHQSKKFNISVTSGSGSSGTYTIQIGADDSTNATTQTSLQITVPSNSGFTVGSNLNLGSNNQERNTTVSGTLTITNGQNVKLTNFAVTDSIPSRYKFNLSGVPSTIDPYQTITLPYELFIPDSQDSGKQRVGQLVFRADQASASKTLTVFVTTRSALTIDSVDFQGPTQSDNNLHNGDRINFAVAPGDQTSFDITLKNLLGNQIYMNNAQVEMTIRNIDNGGDVSETSNTIDIPGNTRQDVTLDFTVPSQADQGTYDVVLNATAEDDNGALHSAQITIRLQVSRPQDQLQIQSFDVTPVTVCPGDSVSVNANVQNTGTDDQPYGRLSVELIGIPGASAIQPFSVNSYGSSSDNYQATMSLTVPQSTKAGTYTARAIAYYGTNQLSDTKQQSIVVQNCGASTSTSSGTTTSSGSSGVVVIQPQQPTTPTTTPTTSTTTQQTSQPNYYVWLLISLNVLVVLLIIVFVIRLLFR